jgi:hypothetical protein
MWVKEALKAWENLGEIHTRIQDTCVLMCGLSSKQQG